MIRPKSAITILLTSTIGLLATAPIGVASSPEAWETFRTKMGSDCRAAALAGDMLREGSFSNDIVVQIEPFGTQSYGVAIVYSDVGRRVCILEKSSGTVELTAPF